jgi:transposase
MTSDSAESSATGPPSIGLLAGQLAYLFEDRPELRRASSAQLAERLNHEDRFARTRSKYPLETDEEVRGHLDEFPARITIDAVDAALARLHDE